MWVEHVHGVTRICFPKNEEEYAAALVVVFLKSRFGKLLLSQLMGTLEQSNAREYYYTIEKE